MVCFTSPLWRALVPIDYVAFTDNEGGGDLCLVVCFLCFSAAFWWSEATIDPAADEVVIVRRWGLSRSVSRQPLSSFEAVSLALNSDGQPEIHLEAKTGDTAIDWNNARVLVWGRLPEEMYDIARQLAARLHLRLNVGPDVYTGLGISTS